MTKWWMDEMDGVENDDDEVIDEMDGMENDDDEMMDGWMKWMKLMMTKWWM